MSAPRYELVFGALRVGIVTQTGADFPNLAGDIACDPGLDDPRSPEAARLARFVALNRESTRLAESEDEGVSPEGAAVDAELEAFADYIESDDWHLIDAAGRRRPILCPVLHASGGIVWRWDVR